MNDQVNRDAASDVPTSETKDGGSGSTDCSFSAIGSLEEFRKLFYEAMETCPNLDNDWYGRNFKWVSNSLYLLLTNAGQEAVQEHIQARLNHLDT